MGSNGGYVLDGLSFHKVHLGGLLRFLAHDHHHLLDLFVPGGKASIFHVLDDFLGVLSGSTTFDTLETPPVRL